MPPRPEFESIYIYVYYDHLIYKHNLHLKY